MKKLLYLFVLGIGFTSCSVESLDSTENLVVADAKLNIQEAPDPMKFYAGNSGKPKGSISIWNDCDNLYVEILPTGDAPDEAVLGLFSTLPEINNGDNLVNALEYNLTDATNLKWTISLSDLGTDQDLLVFVKAWGDWAGSMVHGKQEYFKFQFDLDDCTCEESFTYTANEDGSYTFTYIPAEDMENAKVVFTIPQAVVISGYEWDWNGTSSSRTETMNLEACKSYFWTVNLDTDCKGQGQANANLWTDFTVNEVSKKGDLTNITKSC